MSYGFNMVFAEIGKDNLGQAMVFAREFVQEQMQNAEKMMDDNKYYIPSVRHCSHNTDENTAFAWKEADRYWLQQLFSFRFVYWAQYGILGCCITDECNNESRFPLSVYFQNSWDQDYEFDTWEPGDIPFFKDQIAKIKAADSAKVIADYDCGEDCPEDYCRRSLLYDSIFSTLQLNKWLYGAEGNFERFTLSGIYTPEKLLDLSMILKRKVRRWTAETV